jgi:hypothetical protein
MLYGRIDENSDVTRAADWKSRNEREKQEWQSGSHRRRGMAWLHVPWPMLVMYASGLQDGGGLSHKRKTGKIFSNLPPFRGCGEYIAHPALLALVAHACGSCMSV